MSRLAVLPDDLQNTIWKLCFSHVLKDMMSKYHWEYPPTNFLFHDLKYNTRIRYLSDFGWQSGIYKGQSVTTHFNDLPFYYVDDGTTCIHVVHPSRPISQIFLRHVKLQKRHRTEQKKRYSFNVSSLGSFASFVARFRP